MKALHYIIVEVDNTYNNVQDSIIMGNNVNDATLVNREVKVVSTPTYVNIKPGSKILIHHNILRSRYAKGGKRIDSDFLIKDNLYYVPVDSILMMDEGDGWEAFRDFVFIKPIQTSNIENGLDMGTENAYKSRVMHEGHITHINRKLKELGFEVGDHIGFSKYSEHEYVLEDEGLVYKMRIQMTF